MYPLKTYRPFYYNSYGDSLLKLGRVTESREVFYQEAASLKYRKYPFGGNAGWNLSESLYLDVQLINGKYRKMYVCIISFWNRWR